MYCEHCGSKIADDAKYCHHCGTVVQGKTTESTNADAYYDSFMNSETTNTTDHSQTTDYQQAFGYGQTDNYNQTINYEESTRPATLSIVALVFGILSLACCCCGGGILGIAGIVISIIALNTNCEKRELAIAGLVCSIIATVLFVLSLFVNLATGFVDGNVYDSMDMWNELDQEIYYEYEIIGGDEEI